MDDPLRCLNIQLCMSISYSTGLARQIQTGESKVLKALRKTALWLPQANWSKQSSGDDSWKQKQSAMIGSANWSRCSTTLGTKSGGLDSMHSIPQILRMRSGQSTEGLPELGAVLGRGSFGKVYKGARANKYLSYSTKTA